MTRPGVESLCSLLALLLLPAAASAASYRFVVLADSATEVKPALSKAPSIDEDGTVAFIASASLYGGPYRLLVASQPGAEIFAEYTQVEASLGLTGGQQIGTFTNGKLAYLAASPAGSTIYRWEGGAPVVVQSGTAADDAPAMNGFGEVTFLQDVPRAIVVTDGEDRVEVATLDTVFNDDTEIYNLTRPAPDIDGVGRVAYRAGIDPADCNDRILLSGTNPPLLLASGGGDVEDCAFIGVENEIPIASNDAGSAAYAGDFSTPGGSVDAVFVDATVVWETRIEGFEPPYSRPVVAVALNDVGTVAFLLEFAGVIGRKLYVSADPVAGHVIGRGDPLCEGVVQDVTFHRFGLNDAGELALGIQLTDSRQLIVRAEPTLTEPGACVTQVPEPSAALAFAAAAAGLLAARAAKR
jgi:hypothetical protein